MQINSRSARLLALVLAFGISSAAPASADPATPANGPAVGVFSTPGGQAEVDASRGTLSHDYVFELPAARGVAQPRLAISYASGSGDGEAGFGWSLRTPVIEARPLSGWPEKNSGGGAARYDRYAVNGAPLVAICSTAPNDSVPQCGPAEALPRWAEPGGAGWIYFREQNDRTFARYFLSPDRATWKVQIKGGVTQEFGRPLAMAELAGPAHEMDGRTIVRWRIVRQYETARPQNMILYGWSAMGTRGLLYLNDMWDTPRAGEGPRLTRFAHHTKLFWKPLPYPVTSYASRLQSTPDMLLARVGVTSADWDAVRPRQVIRSYKLEYLTGRSIRYQTGEAPLHRRSFLKSILLEGRCEFREDAGGVFPEAADCTSMPLVTFKYEGTTGNSAFGGLIVKSISPDPTMAQRNAVLPYLNSATLVDFNRDGLPDVVQSWEAEPVCFGKPGYVRVRFPLDGGRALLQCVNANAETVIRSTQPIVGWLNTQSTLQAQFSYQCMDAGDGKRGTLPWFIREGLPPANKPRLASFLAGQGAASIVGSYGDGSLIWGAGEASFRPFRATRTTADAAFCATPNESPAWRWETSSFDQQSWPKETGILGLEEGINGPRWYTDIDADGLTDQLGSATGISVNAYLDSATPFFTRRIGAGDRYNNGTGPAQIPFYAPGEPISVVPKVGAPAGTRFFYADVNADGLVDLAYFPPVGPMVVRPGDGRGNFRCVPSKEPLGCAGDEYLASTPDSPPWSPAGGAAWNQRFERYLHDVTGDGLADILIFRDDTNPQLSGVIQLWVNVDGHTFRCYDTATAVPCIAGRIVDSIHSVTTFGPHRVQFADMDGNGKDELVLLTQMGVGVSEFDVGRVLTASPRPGLLTSIDNGVGATTDVEYKTIAAMMSQDEHDWRTVAPAAGIVVTKLRTHNDPTQTSKLLDPLRLDRRTTYSYRDAAYDNWSRSLVGFRQVDVKAGDQPAVTRTTYWYGPCQQPSIVQACLDGSDDDPQGPITGLPVRVDRIVPGADPYAASKILSSTEYFYEVRTLFDRNRDVRTGFLVGREVREYDASKPFGDGPTGSGGGGDIIVHSPVQAGVVPVAENSRFDDNGNLVMHRSLGRSRDGVNTGISSPASLDPVAVVWFGSDSGYDLPGPYKCDPDLWICYQGAVTYTTDRGADHGYQTLRRERFGYTRQGDLAFEEYWLNPAYPHLARRHADGAEVAPLPSGLTSGSGWRRTMGYSFDETYGGIKLEVRSGEPTQCTTYDWDPAFRQLVAVTSEHFSGCSGNALVKRTDYDRAFATVALAVDQTGQITRVQLDPFGRPVNIDLPMPDGALGATTSSISFAYIDAKPLSSVSTIRKASTSSADSVVVMDIIDGIGRHPARLRARASTNEFIIENWVAMDAAGNPSKSYDTFALPAATLVASMSGGGTMNLTPSSSPVGIEFVRDEFGRVTSVRRSGQEVMRYAYQPYSTSVQNIRQIAGSEPGRTLSTTDGFGREVRVSVDGSGSRVVTEVVYDALGDVVSARRGSPGSMRTVKTIVYDTMGRLVSQSDPESGTFTYGWDDGGRLVGTSDSRGCGKNLRYDGIGRVLGEDYSPCIGTQQDYSAPDDATGAGYELFYKYDAYTTQPASDATYRPILGLARGRLAEIVDRVSRVRIGYDTRGRIRSFGREIGAVGGAPKLPEYVQRTDYDLADRMTRMGTGAHSPELLVNGASDFVLAYSNGLLASVGSSYGSIVASAQYTATDMISAMRYGDLAGTAVTSTYDALGRLSRYSASRVAPALWSAPLGPHELPIETRQKQLFDFVLSFDDLGQATRIEDRAPVGEWFPPGSPQTARSMAYDWYGRLTNVVTTYEGLAEWTYPFQWEEDQGSPSQLPLQTAPTRPATQSFEYDARHNVVKSSDDLDLVFDRSLGDAVLGEPSRRSDRLMSTDSTTSDYDEAGNLTRLLVTRRGECFSVVSPCSNLFLFDWNEIGELSRVRRWDYPVEPDVVVLLGGDPSGTPDWERNNGFSLGQRVVTSLSYQGQAPRYDVDPLSTVHLDQVEATNGAFLVARGDEEVRFAGIATVRYDAEGYLPHNPPASRLNVFLHLPDAFGSSTITIDKGTSEVVERTTYQPYGAVESDFRHGRWRGFRTDRRFGGKVEDVESGLLNFGVRFYLPYLQRFISPDPISVHDVALGESAYGYAMGNPAGNVDPDGFQTYREVDGTIYFDPDLIQPEKHQQSVGAQASGAGSEGVMGIRDANDLVNAALDDNFPLRIPFTYDSYFTVQHTKNQIANIAIDILIERSDPLGIVNTVDSLTGIDVTESVHMNTGGDDPRDKSRIVGTVATMLPMVYSARGVPAAVKAAAEEGKLLLILRKAMRLENAAASRKTIVVALGRNGEIAVATSRAHLEESTQLWLKKNGYIEAVLQNSHAEESLIRGPRGKFLPTRAVVSNIICPRCGTIIKLLGGKLTGPRSFTFPRTLGTNYK